MPTLNDNFYADMERLPFFVYGTLRPGFGNDRLWQGRAAAYFDGEATAPGWGLVDRGIPYAVPAVGMAAVGCLVMPFDDEYPSVARSLDGLEGYPVHYDRVAIDAHMPSGSPIRAWIYTPADTTRFTGERLVEDWGASHLGRLHAYSSAPTASPVPSRPPVVDPDPDPDTLELPVDELTDKQMIRHAIAGGEVRLVDGRVAMLVSWTPARKTGPCKVRFGPSYKRVRRDDIAAALVKVEGRVRS